MSDAVNQENGAGSNGGAGDQGSAKISLPGYVKDNLGKEVYEDWSKRAESDPEFAKQIPPTLADLAKNLDSERTGRAEIAKRLKEVEEARKAPDSPQDYAFDKPKLPEGMVYDQQLEDAFRSWAHEEKLTAGQAKNLLAKFNSARIAQGTQQKAALDATRKKRLDDMNTALRTQWGESYDSRMPRNNAALVNPLMMPQDIVTALDRSGILLSPSFQLWWDRQVSMMSNDRKLGLKGEEGEGFEEEEDKTKKTVTDSTGKAHLKDGFFKTTKERYPARKRAG